MTTAERLALRDLSERIDAHLRPIGLDGDESFTGARRAGGRNTGRIVVTYGLLRGSFQSINHDEAVQYLAWLDAGNVGAPWQMEAEIHTAKAETAGTPQEERADGLQPQGV